MEQSQFKRVAVIGCGRLGSNFAARLADKLPLDQLLLYNRNAKNARHTAKHIPQARTTENLAETLNDSDLVCLAVPDHALDDLARQLAVIADFNDQPPTILHFSGALNSAMLQPLTDIGAAGASFHPLQTFAKPNDRQLKLDGIFCAIESPSAECQRQLSALAQALEMQPLTLQPEHKTLYHVAACIACNYTTTLLHAALSLLDSIGIEATTARAALKPLVEQTLANNFNNGPIGSLTGPVARGEISLIQQQLTQLNSANPQIHALYQALLAPTARLALQQQTLTPEQFDKLLEIVSANKHPKQQ